MTTAGNIMRSRALLTSEGLRYTAESVLGHRVVSLRGEGFIGVAAATNASEYVVLLLPGVTLLRERKPDTSVGEAVFCEAQVQRSTLVLSINIAWRESPATPQQWRDTFAEDLELEMRSAAFRDTSQAGRVVAAAFDHLPKLYRAHHADLLGHQPDGLLFNAFFLARACEAVLRERVSTCSRF